MSRISLGLGLVGVGLGAGVGIGASIAKLFYRNQLVEGNKTTTTKTATEELVVVSELLCYISHHLATSDRSTLIDRCLNFYDAKTIAEAKVKFFAATGIESPT